MTRILIVDDQTEIRHLIRLTLDGQGYELDEAPDADTARQKILAQKPDILILDVMMPGTMDGYGLCEAIKASEQEKDIYVILLTARGQQTDLDRGRAARCDTYLVKPFSPMQLNAIIRNVIEDTP